MPRLLLFAACEKVIVDQQNNTSLISLLQEMQIQIPETGQVPPQNATAAIKWDVLTLWSRTDNDAGKRFEQRFVLFNPAGEATAVSGSTPFDLAKSAHRNVATIYGFPIGSSGRYTLKLWLFEGGKESPQPIAEYPIDVAHEALKK
jgi:hypothetical protein